jgi:hypothetical protein
MTAHNLGAQTTHPAIKPRPDGFLVYADKKLLTLTPVSHEAGRQFAKGLRETHPLMNIELIGVHTLGRQSRTGDVQ